MENKDINLLDESLRLSKLKEEHPVIYFSQGVEAILHLYLSSGPLKIKKSQVFMQMGQELVARIDAAKAINMYTPEQEVECNKVLKIFKDHYDKAFKNEKFFYVRRFIFKLVLAALFVFVILKIVGIV